MKNKKTRFDFRVTLVSLALILAFCPAGLDAGQDSSFFNSDIDISMDFQDASIKDVLKILSIQSGMNFIASEGVQDRKVTLYLNKVPLRDAMDKIFKANNLSYDLDKSANIFIVKDWGKPTVETVTKVFFLKYATVSTSALEAQKSSSDTDSSTSSSSSSESSSSTTSSTTSSDNSSSSSTESTSGITEAVKKVISSNGSVVEDARTNSLIVTDIPNRMPIIAQTIAALDIPLSQVMLEVEMLDVNKNAVDKIGFKWGSSTGSQLLTMVLTGAKSTTAWPFKDFLPLPKPMRQHDISQSITAGTIDFSNPSYTVLLDFFRSQTDTRILARPRIMTMNNQTAEIKITTNETIGVTTESITTEGTAQTTQFSPERVETGVSLKVTPQINEDTGEITMYIVPTVKDTSTSSFTGSNSQAFKDPEERSTKATVRIRDTETVVIGGLIRKEKAETITKLPFLGDIPFVRKAFTHTNKEKDRQRELLVFITPHIIRDKAVAAELARAQKPNMPEREQSTTSKIDREATISASLNEFEGKRR